MGFQSRGDSPGRPDATGGVAGRRSRCRRVVPAEPALMQQPARPTGEPAVTRLQPYSDPDDDARLRRELERSWHLPRGILGWLSVNDHRVIGKRYIVTA